MSPSGSGAEPVETELIPGGPLLVRGAREITDADGTSYAVTRSVVAVCVCGLSQRKPWCDATHKVRAKALEGRECPRSVS